MKTTMIARCVFAGAAIFAAAGLIGCGAESGQGESGAIGSASEALHGTIPAVGSNAANSLAAGLKFAAHCRLLDTVPNPDVEYFVMAGGVLDGVTPAETSQIIARTATGSWASIGSTLQSARSNLAFVQDPTDASACYVAGGELAGAASAHVEKISVSNGVFTVTNKTDMNVARSRFALSTCGSGLIAFGGYDGAATTKELSSIEASASLGGAWTTTTTKAVPGGALGTALGDDIYEFAFAKDPSSDKYLIAGGALAGGSTAHIEQITASVAAGLCTPSVAALNTTTKLLSNLVQGNVAFPEGGTANRFVVTGGALASSGATPTTINLVDVNWTTPGSTAISSSGNLSVGVYRPTLVGPIHDPAHGTDKDAYTLVSGGTFSAGFTSPTLDATTAKTDVQTYQSSFGLLAATSKLTSARFGNSAVLFTLSGSPVVYSAAGESAFSPKSYPTTMETIAP